MGITQLLTAHFGHFQLNRDITQEGVWFDSTPRVWVFVDDIREATRGKLLWNSQMIWGAKICHQFIFKCFCMKWATCNFIQQKIFRDIICIHACNPVWAMFLIAEENCSKQGKMKTIKILMFFCSLSIFFFILIQVILLILLFLFEILENFKRKGRPCFYCLVYAKYFDLRNNLHNGLSSMQKT